MTFTKYNNAELLFIQDTLSIYTDTDTDDDYNDESEDFYNYYNKE
jgi:hypothetical protein